MTNKDDAAFDRSPRMAALLAVHLVSEVLDEAYVIANALLETGQPWRNLSITKSSKTSRLGKIDVEDSSFEASKGDGEANDNKAEVVANVVVTSTPEKATTRATSSDDDLTESIIIHGDNPFIGQGDGDIEAQQIELANSTSMFINHLFDMSDVERIVMCDETEILQSTSESNNMIIDVMNNIVKSYVSNNLVSLDEFSIVPNAEITEGEIANLSRSDNPDFSLMADAFVADIKRDVTFYIEDDNSRDIRHDIQFYQPAVVEELVEIKSGQDGGDRTQVIIHTIEDSDESNKYNKNNVAYEDAYATLNRDYDQASEDDAFPDLQDPKAITLQEVELMTADTTDDELACYGQQNEQYPEGSVPTVTGVSVSRKSTLVRRCRIQGARFLACLRGWWRRKTPGKRKDSRVPGNVIGMCPLSPDARRRASSLLDNRLLRSPSPSRPVIWKFNTVNESLVNSNRWKDYTFDPNPEECGILGEI